MEHIIRILKSKVLSGVLLTKEEALQLEDVQLEPLARAADEIRQQFCGNRFDLCTIINGKNGRCSENCKYCAQSSFYDTQIEAYPLMGTDEIVEQAKYNAVRGVPRYSIVTSGKKLSIDEIENVCKSIQKIKETVEISVCVSFGLQSEEDFQMLKEAGAVRVHNNLETSRAYFPEVCTTHSYDEKIETLKAAQRAGLSVCSGGIMGMGESMEDRIDLAVTVRDLGVKSIAVNMLNPIPGTPYENTPKLTISDMRRITAIFRFIAPDAFIRLAGGRGLMDDKGELCFQSGANAAITGDMLTTSGITIEQDMKMLEKLGYEVV